jgi:glycosyltransferase involved in cell wall biosynthesis
MDASTRGDRPRILVITPWDRMWSLDAGAGVSDEHHFIAGFTRAGYEVHFLAPAAPEAGATHYENVELHTYPNFFHRTAGWPSALRRLLWPLLFHLVVAPPALRLLRALRPVFVLGLSHYTPLTTWLCRRAGVPAGVKLAGVMDLVHTEWPRARYFFKNFEQLAALRFPQDAWIVLDDGTRGGDVLHARGIDPAHIHFLPNGLDVEWLDAPAPDRGAARARLGIPGAARVVLFLARLVASKRPIDLVRAARAVLARGGGETLFVFAGDGPERAESEEAARAAGVAGHVCFTGVVPHDEVPALMAASDVFVSTSNLTNMALPTCEALICGVPVIAYDVGDTARVVRHGETGLLVPDGDVDALAAAVAALLDDAPARARMGQAGRRLARERFTRWDARVDMEVEIVRRIVAGKEKGAARRAAPA